MLQAGKSPVNAPPNRDSAVHPVEHCWCQISIVTANRGIGQRSMMLPKYVMMPLSLLLLSAFVGKNMRHDIGDPLLMIGY